MSNEIAASRPRLAHLDGLRALAALWVVFSHAEDTVFHKVDADGPMNWVVGWMNYGHLAVVAFIVISGYSLALGVVRNDGRFKRGTLAFLKARFRRIVPPYWAAVTVSLLLTLFLIDEATGTKWDDAINVTPLGTIAHYLLLQDLIDNPAPNHPLWTISVEWQIYFLFPLMLLAFRRINIYVAAAAGATVTLAATKLLTADVILLNSLYLIGAFMLGVAACYLVEAGGAMEIGRFAARLPYFWIFAVCLLAGIALAVRGSALNLFNAPTELGVAALLVAIGAGRAPRLGAALSWRPLVRIGFFSYSIYLMHAPLLQVIWQFGIDPFDLSRDAQMLLLGGPGVVVIVALCWVFFWAAERPFLTKQMKRAEAAEVGDGLGVDPAEHRHVRTTG